MRLTEAAAEDASAAAAATWTGPGVLGLDICAAMLGPGDGSVDLLLAIRPYCLAVPLPRGAASQCGRAASHLPTVWDALQRAVQTELQVRARERERERERLGAKPGSIKWARWWASGCRPNPLFSAAPLTLTTRASPDIPPGRNDRCWSSTARSLLPHRRQLATPRQGMLLLRPEEDSEGGAGCLPLHGDPSSWSRGPRPSARWPGVLRCLPPHQRLDLSRVSGWGGPPHEPPTPLPRAGRALLACLSITAGATLME